MTFPWRYLLLAVGCAGSGACASDHAPRAGDAGDAGMANADAAAPAEPRTVAQPLCREACVENEPNEKPGFFCPTLDADCPERTYCSNDDVADCERACARAIDDTDESCGRCIVDALDWSSATGGCNDFECGCDGGSATFPTPLDMACRSACSATLERRANTRRDAPTPENLGHAPVQVVELPELRAIGSVRADGDGFWLTAGGVVGAQVARVDADFNLSFLGAQQATGLALEEVVGAPQGEGWFLAHAGLQQPARLLRYAPDGAQIEPRELDPKQAYQALVHRGDTLLAATEDYGFDVFSLASGGRTERLAQRANSDFGGGRLLRLAQGPGGALVVAGTDGRRGVVAWFDDVRAAPRFKRLFAGESGQVLSVSVDPNGNVALGGSLYVKKQLPSGSTITHTEPFAARLSSQGELIWQWQFGADVAVAGKVHAVLHDSSGNVYSVGVEDPHNDSGNRARSDACSVYGCDALVVRKFFPGGELRWEYQHRSASSVGNALALDEQGSLVVAGDVSRESPAGILLRFAPD